MNYNDTTSTTSAFSLGNILPFLTTLILSVLIAFAALYSETDLWTDHGWHQDYAARWYATGTMDPPLPHFAYHVTLIGLKIILPNVDWRWLGLGTMTVSFAILGVLIYRNLVKLNAAAPIRYKWLCSILTLALLFVTPITLFTWSTQNLYLGYILPTVYHNPTVALLKPIAFAQFLVAIHLLTAQPVSFRLVVGITLLNIAGLFVKPSYALSLLPALALITFWRMVQRRAVAWRTILVAFGIVNSLILMGQYYFQYVFNTDTRGAVIFAPLQSLQFYEPTVLWIVLKFLLSIAFPVLVFVTNWQSARRSLPLCFAWLAFFFSSLQFFLFNETAYPTAGNFWWGAQICLLILMIVSTQFWLSQLLKKDAKQHWLSTLGIALTTIVLVFHGISASFWWGIHAYQTFYGNAASYWW